MRAQWFASALLLLSPLAARGQDQSTGYQRIRLQAYGLGSFVRPDFQGAANNVGVTAGGSLNVGIPHVRGVKVGLDARYVYSSGDDVNESSFEVGPQLMFGAGRLHAYADYLAGAGTITFNKPFVPGYTHNDSAVYTVGGGVDLGITPTIALRLDAQQQRWKLEQAAPAFYPKVLSIGIRYQFRFHDRRGPG